MEPWFHAAGQAAPEPDPAANPHVVRVVIHAADPAANPHVVRVVIHAADPRAPPAPRVPSSRTIARMRERGEAEARNAAAAQAPAKQVQPGLRPPTGRLLAIDAALPLRGSLGGIGRSANHAHPSPASRRWQAPAGSTGGAAGGWHGSTSRLCARPWPRWRKGWR
jgi:hypothetical protein